MAYDQELADGIRRVLASIPGVREIEMMDGLCFMVRGHMCCGVVEDELMARVGPARYEEALSTPHARPSGTGFVGESTT